MEFIAQDKQSKKLIERIKEIAPTKFPVFLWGESGVGKNEVAKLIHSLSGRKGLFLILGSFNIRNELVESLFFGYKKGAFSDAYEDREGFLKRADGGTIYLDMIQELGIEVQMRIFNALENKEFIPLGKSEPSKSDFRVIASSLYPLEELFERGLIIEKFLHFFTFSLRIAPLRERKRDIIPLVKHFCKGKMKIEKESEKSLLAHPWFGNVREIRNFVDKERAMGKERIGSPEVSPALFKKMIEEKAFSLPNLRELELWYIKKVLEHFKGNKTRAAKALGITRKTLLRKLKD